jgi:hypothetical protein
METLSGIKEYDFYLNDKINIIETNFYNKSNHSKYEQDKIILSKYILNIKEFQQLSWDDKLEALKKYVNTNKLRPSSKSLDIQIKRLGQWYMDQKYNYENNIKTMKISINRNKWEKFNKEYSKYFMSIIDEWEYNLIEVKLYIDKYDKRPNSESNISDIKYIGQWLCRQCSNYKNNINSMTNDINKKKWLEFITNEKYSKFFINNDDEWNNMLNKIINYMDNKIEEQKTDNSIKNRNIRPYINNVDTEINNMACWLQNQKQYYQKQIKKMDEPYRKIKWENFINKYDKYLLSIDSEWEKNYEDLKQYIIDNNYKKLPSEESTNPIDKYLGKWVSHQKLHYKKITGVFKNEHYLEKWKDFNTNFLLKIEETLNNDWFDKYNELLLYIQNEPNNKLPQNIKTDDKKYRELYLWSNNQKTQYRKNAGFMKNDLLKNKWLELINRYPKTFRTLEEIWIDKLNDLDNYISVNKKLPDIVIDDELYKWYKRESYHYNNTLKLLKNKEINKLWETFLEKHKLILNKPRK